MSNIDTHHMIEAYQEHAKPTLFLSSFFQSPPSNFYETKDVELDVGRATEEISVVIQDIATGYRWNSKDIYTNKRFIAPVHNEAFPIDSSELKNRMMGQNPFGDIDFRFNILNRAFDGMDAMTDKIRRSIELQASQIFQDGVLALPDYNAGIIYNLNFSPKASHLVTVGTAWDVGGSLPLKDIELVADVIRTDGKIGPDQLIMGQKSFTAFIQNATVIPHFEVRRVDQGTISGFEAREGGGIFRGIVTIGAYQYDVFTYDGRYDHPTTGTSTPFLLDTSVIVRSSRQRLDATFGTIDNIGKILGLSLASRFPELPSRIVNSRGQMDMHTNIWMSPDGLNFNVSVGSRPLLMPTAQDLHARINTLVT